MCDYDYSDDDYYTDLESAPAPAPEATPAPEVEVDPRPTIEVAPSPAPTRTSARLRKIPKARTNEKPVPRPKRTALPASKSNVSQAQTIRKMMAIVNALKLEYPLVNITKDDEKALRDIARTVNHPHYNPGHLFGFVQKKYGSVNPLLAIEVRVIFREAGYLPSVGSRPTRVVVKRRRVKPVPVVEPLPTSEEKAKLATQRAERANRRAQLIRFVPRPVLIKRVAVAKQSAEDDEFSSLFKRFNLH